MAHDHVCADCGATAVAGVGSPPRWLCQEHFEADLAATFDRIHGFTVTATTRDN